MKRVRFIFTIAALLLAPLSTVGTATLAAPAATQPQQAQTITVKMNAQNGSGEDGTATITAAGPGMVMVMIDLANGPSTPQPAHIHRGTCANLDPAPFSPLTNVVNGKSDSTVPPDISDLLKGGYAINIHKSAAEVATYVSCGDIMAETTNPATPGTAGSPPGGVPAPFTSVVVQMHEQNGSGQNGTAVITLSGQDQVTVVLDLMNNPANPQPAHIHKGSCANLDPKPAYPLTNVVNGKSQTTVTAGIGDLAMQGYAINVHKSAAEANVYTSCGDITVQNVGGQPGAQPTVVPGGSMGGMPMPGTTTGGTTGGTTTGGAPPGMPTTGQGDQPFALWTLALLALALIGTGLVAVRRRA
jgi:Cu/Zn superoxide dismutase